MQVRSLLCFALVLTLVVIPSWTSAQVLLLQDSLHNGTSGTRSGGAFTGSGWRVTGKKDCIYWHIPTTPHGAVEFDVAGLRPNECRPGMEDKSELFHMYDHSFGTADTVYDPGYRNNAFKHFVRKIGCLGSYNNSIDAHEIVWKIGEPYDERDTPRVSWNPAATYHYRIEWNPEGGNTALRTYRDGLLLLKQTLPGSYAPAGHSVRIAASPRDAADAGAPIDAVFSNLKVWRLSVPAAPAAPGIVAPADGETLNTRMAFIQWAGDLHTRYQVRITRENSPESGIAWDSQDTTSGNDFSFTGELGDRAGYHAWVRLAGPGGFGPWSAGRSFRIDTGFVPPGSDRIRLQGNTLKRNSGPVFNGLGVSYMQALRRCKYDRPRLESDLTFLAARGFNYIRILSMVGWYEAWQGKEIAPVSFTSRNGTSVAAWPDYWQQLRDCIDIAYDKGLLTQVTIFADAQLMPAKADRINHMNLLLQNLAGREHKVILLEVGNEAWQNGFPELQGVMDLREFAQYLGARTEILVAISATPGPSDVGLEQMYAFSAADIATEHFTRDKSAPEGAWLPVLDCWRVSDSPHVPPGSSNEPIGPGSSVASESDPVKLVMAAAFAWGADLPMYVYHTGAGVFGDTAFQDMAGVNDYIHLREILPGELAGWARNDGKEPAAPFTTHANGQPNKWSTEVPGATSGAVRHTGKIKGGEFISFPIGILSGGVELEARRPVSFRVYHPLTGKVVQSLTRQAGQRFTLAQGPGAYIIRGEFQDVPGENKEEASIDLGSPDIMYGLWHPQEGDGDTTPAVIGNRTCRRNLNPAEDFYFYFNVSDAFAFQGSWPEVFITVEYFDAGTGSLALQYDSSVGTGLPAYYRSGGSIPLSGTNTWKQRTLHIGNAWFANRQNYGADFRFGNIGQTFHLDRLRVGLHLPQDYDQDGDVDLADFGHFQACLSGPGRVAEAGCADADHDRDGDVDGLDFTTFVACLGGAQRPVGC